MADHLFALALSGGNALGAFHAGAYHALDARGVGIDWIVGASAGAITGALIAGNPPDRRIGRLTEFWRPDHAHVAGSPALEHARRSAAAAATLAVGEPSIFVPRIPGWPQWAGQALPRPSLYDTAPLRRTLTRLIDFGLLQGGLPRLTATAVDLDRGTDVAFDGRHGPITVDHLLASSALMPAFPPVEINGRLFGDAGMSANLPLDPILAEGADRPILCLAIDLLPLSAPRPVTIGDATDRLQDLLFAAQTRRTLSAWQAIFTASPPRSPITVMHISYADQEAEVAGKAMDFSPGSAGQRWASGRRAAAAALDAVAAGGVPIDQPGFHLVDGRGAPIRWGLTPDRVA